MTGSPHLMARDVHFAFDSQPTLDEIELALEPGDLLVVLGPNGAGKSTLLRLLAGLLTPTRGSIELEGRPMVGLDRRSIARRIAWVPQTLEVPFDFTVGEFVTMARYALRPPLRPIGSDDLEAARNALALVGADRLIDRPLREVSGGERQKSSIAAALAQEAPILLLDEPTASLDPRHAIEIYEILGRLRREEARTIVSVTHDLTLAARFGQTFLLLDQGRAVALGPADDVLRPEVLEPVYGISWQLHRGPDRSVLLPDDPR